MQAVTFVSPGTVEISRVPDPAIEASTDAIVRVEVAGVCGSDLWTYRGARQREAGSRMGHEFVGVIEQIGSEAPGLGVGDWVVSPFTFSDGICAHCATSLTSSCINGGVFGGAFDGGQGEYVRVPFAAQTLVRIADVGDRPDPDLLPDLLTLADVFSTGHHAAVSSRVVAGSTVAVVGDGAVGLSAILASVRLGASRIIAFSSHADRQDAARKAGATDIIASRGDDAVAELKDLTRGWGAESVLECVGTPQAFTTAVAVARDGGTIGYVGIPHGVELPVADLFARNVSIAGGLAPARRYIPELLPDVLAGSARPGAVFTREYSLSEAAVAYADMDERRTIKALIRR